MQQFNLLYVISLVLKSESGEIFVFCSQNRIKKIMQKDADVGRIAMAVPVIICIPFKPADVQK